MSYLLMKIQFSRKLETGKATRNNEEMDWKRPEVRFRYF